MFFECSVAAKKRQKLGFPYNFIADWAGYSSTYFDKECFTEREGNLIKEYFEQIKPRYSEMIKLYYLDMKSAEDIVHILGSRDIKYVKIGLGEGFQEVKDEIDYKRSLFPSLKSKYGFLYKYDYFEGVPAKKSVWEVSYIKNSKCRAVIQPGNSFLDIEEVVEYVGGCRDYCVWLTEDNESRADALYYGSLLGEKIEHEKKIAEIKEQIQLLDNRLDPFYKSGADISTLIVRDASSEERERIFDQLEIIAAREQFAFSEEEIEYIKNKGNAKIEEYIRTLIGRHLLHPDKTSGQRLMPQKGNPVYLAMYMAGCSSRRRLHTFHRIDDESDLTKDQQDYVVDFVMEWIQRVTA